ncbi:MAG: imidazoleglycerol-phosphate dehydratase HisB [Proteobacteria bacterium]|nr:imidazoleglycerol-phosphate dehydratase HisB [Pseudomonadota bacterium]MBU1640247.1 imidazoleglycerol-phosphate dehydratase HisB [Pseudomonadota bacterium]
MPSVPTRKSTISRSTKETSINLELSLDGQGKADISTGVPFFDHMLTLLTVHGFFNLTLKASGDIEVDDHHTVEDIGICLGQAFKEALGDFSSISRYGHFSLPMDETLARVTIDFSNRPYLHYDVIALDQKTGTFDTTMVQEFLRAFAFNCGLTLHVEVKYGVNTHHIIEAIFKALGRTLDQATAIDPRVQGTLSSKGTL